MFPGKYPPYDDGMKEDIFIHNATGGVLVGQVCIVPDTCIIVHVDICTVVADSV